jgi:citrate lyase subunit beta/citryl-CoA lyase
MNETIRPRRSALYMPGANARALDKARGLPADVLLLDLEDSVSPDMKETARAQVVEAVRAGGFGRREVVIRINGLDTPWGDADLDAAAAAAPDAILVPKVADPALLRRIGSRLDDTDTARTTRVWAMIETPAAFLNVDVIAASARDPATRLACFILGLNDLAKETRIRFVPGRAPMWPLMMQALCAARAHGIDILDGVFNDIRDEAGFAAECEAARDAGFDGKTLIHPGQIETANATFAPDAGEVERARLIAEVFDRPEHAGKGAIAIDGRMVERLHAEMARRTLALAAAIAAAG